MKKIILGTVGVVSGIVFGAAMSIKFIVKPTGDELNKTRQLSNKHLDLYMLMNDWLYIKQQGKNLSDFFEQNSYKRIAIYGMNYVGRALNQELKGTGIKVVAGIDKSASDMGMVDNVKIYAPDDFLEAVDAIIVTPITYFDNIVDLLEQKKVECPIISIEDVICAME